VEPSNDTDNAATTQNDSLLEVWNKRYLWFCPSLEYSFAPNPALQARRPWTQTTIVIDPFTTIFPLQIEATLDKFIEEEMLGVVKLKKQDEGKPEAQPQERKPKVDSLEDFEPHVKKKLQPRMIREVNHDANANGNV